REPVVRAVVSEMSGVSDESRERQRAGPEAPRLRIRLALRFLIRPGAALTGARGLAIRLALNAQSTADW
ncbi:MAG: hypothetical protein AB7K09_14975, partial [Planctomycetota bacterium]